MKVAGFLLMPAGWIIALTAVAILPPGGAARAAFILAGISIEILGLVLVFRSHTAQAGGEQ